MSAAYVPAVDLAGYELWADAHGRAHSLAAETFATNGIPDGWRRLYVREEPAAEPVGLVTLIHHLAYREPTDGAS